MNEELMKLFAEQLEQLNDLLEVQLAELERSASGMEHLPHIREIIDHFRQQAAALRAKKPERMDDLEVALRKVQGRLN
jgi:hypothetical protein